MKKLYIHTFDGRKNKAQVPSESMISLKEKLSKSPSHSTLQIIWLSLNPTTFIFGKDTIKIGDKNAMTDKLPASQESMYLEK